MKNTISDLNNYLFESLERLQDDSLNDEELARELKRAKGVRDIAGRIIETENLAFQVIKHKDNYGYDQAEQMPVMLEAK